MEIMVSCKPETREKKDSLNQANNKQIMLRRQT